jgi:hypothetical protein
MEAWMEPILLVIALATLGELIIEALKPGLQPLIARLSVPPDVNVYLYLSLALGMALAGCYRADLLWAVGLSESATVVGVITTGLFIGRGANFVSDVISRLNRPDAPIG